MSIGKKLTGRFFIINVLIFYFFSSMCLANDLDITNYIQPFKPKYLYDLVDTHPEEADRLDSYFKIKKRINEKPGSKKKVISYSLFCIPKTTTEINWKNIKDENVIKCKHGSFFDSYIAPLLKNLSELPNIHPNWIARIYLSSNLEFLIDRYFAKYPFVEIFLMGDSINHSPGAMWRFLAFDDPNIVQVIFKDTDLGWNKIMEHSFDEWFADPQSTGFVRWRKVPLHKTHIYNNPDILWSTIQADQIGGKNTFGLIHMEKAMKGFIIQRELYTKDSKEFEGKTIHRKNIFPNYGFDERFLSHVLYYYAISKGIFKTLPNGNVLLPYQLITLPKENGMVRDYMYIEKHVKN